MSTLIQCLDPTQLCIFNFETKNFDCKTVRDKSEFARSTFRTIKPRKDVLITLGKLKGKTGRNDPLYVQRICKRKK